MDDQPGKASAASSKAPAPGAAKPAPGAAKPAPGARAADVSKAPPAAVAAKRGSGRAGGLLSKAAEKVPMRWLTTAVAGVFLAATAAFGGLETAASTLPADLAAGETHIGPFASFTLERAVLIDTFDEAGATADPAAGERVLALVGTVEGTWDRSMGTDASTFVQAVRLEAMPDASMTAAARLDDATLSPKVQPGVPAELVLTWIVPEDLFADGDEVRVSLFDHQLYVGSSTLYGEYWSDQELAATVVLEVEDVGAGADAEADGEEAP
ncbi:hypothetical protein [Agrococcus sp. Marseille-P2731]|uniref:hypothetical protein n=1 Tax=Agrococcus sp. Marseille-P2731 TaxID=1841862 RepID=UPI0009F94A0C|nr:hypothetical protein [Agrococcus sp. Marseille-P2731]